MACSGASKSCSRNAPDPRESGHGVGFPLGGSRRRGWTARSSRSGRVLALSGRVRRAVRAAQRRRRTGLAAGAPVGDQVGPARRGRPMCRSGGQGLAGPLEDPRLPAASPVVTCSDDSCSGRAGQARPDRAGQARPGPGSTGRRRAGSTPRSCTGCRRRPGCAGPGSPIGRSGWPVRGRSALARSQSGPNRSGPGGRSRGSPRRWTAVRARAAGSPPPATPLQHRPYLPGWTAAPGVAWTIQVPHAVHPEAGVQSQVRLHPDEPSACRATPPPGPPGRRGRPWRAAGPGSRCGSASGRRAPHGGAARPATPCRPRAHAHRHPGTPSGTRATW